MTLIDSIKNTLLIPLHPKGRNIVIIAMAITIFLFLFSDTLGTIGAILTVFTYYFFRDPDRLVPQGEGIILSHADGTVDYIEEKVALPAELGLSAEDNPATYKRISIYISLFDNHVNRAPVTSVLEREVYVAGKFINASMKEASQENERSIASFRTESGERIACTQIAGMVSRVVVCQAYEGDNLEAGQRYGIIRFGCRGDIYVPEHYHIMVTEGSIVRAGETIIAANIKQYKPKNTEWKKI